MSHYRCNVWSQTRASLRSVSRNHISLNQAIQTHPFIQNQVINHPGWARSASLFFLFLFLPLVSPCDKTVDRWVCRCVHWSKMTGGPWVCCLETVAWQAWQGGPAAPRAGKGTGQTRRPGAVTETRSALAMYREIICLRGDGFLRCVAFVMRALHLSIGGRQTIRRQEETKTERGTVEQRSQAGIKTGTLLAYCMWLKTTGPSSKSLRTTCTPSEVKQKRKRGSSNTVSGMLSFVYICYFIVFPSVQMMWQLNKVFPALPQCSISFTVVTEAEIYCKRGGDTSFSTDRSCHGLHSKHSFFCRLS